LATVREWLVQNPYAIGLNIQYMWTMYETAPQTFNFSGTFGQWLDALAAWSYGGDDAIDSRQFYLIAELSAQTFVSRQSAIPLYYIPNNYSWFVERDNDSLYATWQIGTGAPGIYNGCVIDLIGEDPGASRVMKPHWQDINFSRPYGAAIKQLAQDFANHSQGHRLVAMVSGELALDPEQEVGEIWQHKLGGHWGNIANQTAMIALSNALPGDTCYRTDTSSVWMLKSGGSYSVASDWLDSTVPANLSAMLSWQSLRTYRDAFTAPFRPWAAGIGESMAMSRALEILPQIFVVVRSANATRFEDTYGSRLYHYGTGTPDIRAGYTSGNFRAQLRIKLASVSQVTVGETQNNSWWSPFDGTQETISATFDRIQYVGCQYFSMYWTTTPDGVTREQWQTNVLAELSRRGGVNSFLNTAIPSGYVVEE
jgi:hypothetical protein